MNVVDVLQFIINEGVSIEDLLLKERNLRCTSDQTKIVRPGKLLVKRKPKVSSYYT